jgi:hypothetical protein
MRIDGHLLDLLLSRVRVEYSGVHNSDPKNLLWGARAYFRLYAKDTDSYITKITVPVNTLKPSKKTLDRLLRAELKSRLGEIEEVCTTDGYGRVQIESRDPWSLRYILNLIDGKYVDLMIAGRQ